MYFLKSSHVLTTLLFITISQNIFTMNVSDDCLNVSDDEASQKEEIKKQDNAQEQQAQEVPLTHEEKMNAFKEQLKEEKVKNYRRNNQMNYIIAANIGDHAAKGFMEFLAKTASESILEVVKRELDIRYDKDPSVALELNEIATGITIINNTVALSDELHKKAIKETSDLDLSAEERKKKIRELQEEVVHNYKDLSHLRNEHIDQLNALRKKRNPNFVPYSKSNSK